MCKREFSVYRLSLALSEGGAIPEFDPALFIVLTDRILRPEKQWKSVLRQINARISIL